MNIVKSQAGLFVEELTILVSFTWGFLVRAFILFCITGAAITMGALLAADPDTTTFKDFLLVVQSPATWSTAVILAIIVSFLRTLYVQRKQALLKLRKG